MIHGIHRPAQMGLPTIAPPPRQLVRAAHEFEAQMMKELLKPLTSNQAPGDEDADSGSAAILGQFGAEALGRALSEHGGVGIATEIVRSLSSSGKSPQLGESDRKLHRNATLGKPE